MGRLRVKLGAIEAARDKVSEIRRAIGMVHPIPINTSNPAKNRELKR
jgi:hypothetical protein